jgi:hypothetical protein
MCLGRSKYFCLIIFCIFLLPYLSCDHGLEPSENNQSQKSGISGTISYFNWPPADSLYDLRLVVFEKYPPEDILSEVTEERAHVYPGFGKEHLPYYVDTTTYVMELDPGYYEYVAIAQQYGSNLLTDWLAAGKYDTLFSDEVPTPIMVISGEFLEDINIHVDFDDLPPQPF